MFSTVKKVINWIGRYKKRVYLGFVLSFLIAGFSAVPIIIAGYTVHHLLLDFRGEASLPANFALLMLSAIAVSVVIKFILIHLRGLAQESIGYEITSDERIEIGSVLKRVSLGYFEQHKTGDITATITTQLTLLEHFGIKMVDNIVGGYITTGVTVLFMAFFSIKAALISIAGILLSGGFLKLVNILSRKAFRKVHKAQQDMTRSVIEYLHGMSDVKSYGGEGASLSAIKSAFKSSMDINISVEKKYAPINAMHVLSLKLATCGIFFIVSRLFIDGSMSFMYSVMMLMFSITLFSTIQKINNASILMGIIESNIANLNRIKQAVLIDADSNDIDISNYDININDVSFAYDSVEVIKDVSIKIPQQSMTAIVGPSGSGKTTLCNLIARFYDVQKGSISIGGHNVREFTCDSLLKNISMVFQKVYLFHDTIYNNILFGNPEATEQQVITAAKKARCHDFIIGLPDGYQTVVGEGGSTLSGGEKQRISIARAILKDAPIVMLDEATASIDPENEHFIQAAINELTNGKTVIAIAHKISTVTNADKIIVLKDGRVFEQGRHEELIKNGGVYKRFIEIRQAAEGWKI